MGHGKIRNEAKKLMHIAIVNGMEKPFTHKDLAKAFESGILRRLDDIYYKHSNQRITAYDRLPKMLKPLLHSGVLAREKHTNYWVYEVVKKKKLARTLTELVELQVKIKELEDMS